ncbi:hypothetical protein J4460_00880 [Candidatus Woesearchaeota archaeon]|nr:MAG: hypothetical protein QS99_C0002G0010 [archaeon GW2011_AR4]MBS3129204.1 hypothetical protein [Candidatus Woesearchaeota archaeon]HIH39037.1 hypothetical protein [Candidatus Woesearchaeota archaeon]HIH48344.1 hypothetical protein [Candidatus Woesearchaeota archaeon]HIJ04064.1 hypothetical protein [Candidatus Woesearchaeota archaeon]
MKDAFSPANLGVMSKLTTPIKVQELIGSLSFNQGKRLSPVQVLEQRRADCLEAAVFAHAVFQFHGIDSFLIDLRAVHDEDHILCAYKSGSHLGAVAQSKFLHLRFRSPVYKTGRDLVMSYFEHYFNFFGELSLREFSVPIRLKKGGPWLSDPKETIKLEQYLDTVRHFKVDLPEKPLPKVSKERFWREILILPEGTRVGKEYRKEVRSREH